MTCVPPRFSGFEVVYTNTDNTRLTSTPTQQMLKNDSSPSTPLGGNWIDYITDKQMLDYCSQTTTCKYIVANRSGRRLDAYTNLKPEDIGYAPKLTEGTNLTIYKKI